MSVTFDGITLRNPGPFDLAPTVLCNETILLSGGTAVQTTPVTGFRAQFQCMTRDYVDVSLLLSKIGRKGPLVIDGVSYSNCAIRSWDRLEQNPIGTWWYAVTFVRDTT